MFKFLMLHFHIVNLGKFGKLFRLDQKNFLIKVKKAQEIILNICLFIFHNKS